MYLSVLGWQRRPPQDSFLQRGQLSATFISSGDFASENVKDLVVPQLVACPAWQQVIELLRTDASTFAQLDEKTLMLLGQAVVSMYKNADTELVKMCEQLGKDYASSTSVTAILVNGVLAVGHLVSSLQT